MTMRLEVSRRADLAVQALAALGAADRRMKASELADLLGSTAGFVPQVLSPLVERGWISSEPGPTGGYSCRVSLTDVSVLDVIEAVEGPTENGRCVLEDRPCSGDERCALHVPWVAARAELLDSLAQTSVATIPISRSPR